MISINQHRAKPHWLVVTPSGVSAPRREARAGRRERAEALTTNLATSIARGWPCRRGLFAGCAALLLSTTAWAAPQAFVLREYLGKAWSNEVVTFPLAADTLAQPGADLRLLGPEGKAVPFQFVTGADGARTLAFQTDLPAFSELSYRLANGDGAKPPATDLRIDQEATLIRLSSALVGIEIPTAKGAFANGPFLRMKLRSGSWIGASRLTSKTPIESYTTTVLASGPVFAEIACQYRFAGGRQWQVTFRVEAHEPAVLVSETCNLTDGSAWQLLVSPGFSPSHSLTSVSYGLQDKAKYSLDKLNFNGGAPLSLAPWPIWWNPSSIGFLGLFKLPPGAALVRGRQEMVALPGTGGAQPEVKLEARPDADAGAEALETLVQEDAQTPKGVTPLEDFLGVAVGQAEFWANPGEDGQAKSLPLCTGTNGELFLSCALAGPGRRWLLAALTTKENLVPETELSAAQVMMNKHLETSLNEVLHMVLDWDSKSAGDYPRLVTRRSELAARPQMAERTAFRRGLITDDTPGVRARQLLYPATKIFLGSPDQPAQSMDTVHRCERIIRIATAADLLLGSDVITQAELSSALGFHAIEWGRPVLTDKDVFSAADIRYARAQIAFLAYKLFSPNYYSLERNYRANPNMTTTRYCAMSILACLVPDHPRAREWAQGGLDEVERELKTWTGPNGGWLESPHYQTVAMSSILLLSLGARNAGFTDYLHDVRLERALRYLARISTPPDPRFDNKRHFPPAGNTYQFETTGQFGVLAKACRVSNPELAAELQWAWIQQGKSTNSGIGGDFYNGSLYADFAPATAPQWGSELFPGSGAVLRTGFPGPRETYLYLLQGGFAEHYDVDRGSFEFWGKGRPLCLDWGYSFKVGRMPAWQHNRVDIGNWGEVKTFQTSATADYLLSRQEAWNRQLLLMKDADPLGPNYFVLRDAMAQGAANWWLWFYTEHSLQLTDGVLQVTGMHDVDLDVWLAPKLTRHLKTTTKPKVREKKAAKPAAPTEALGDAGRAPAAADLDAVDDIMKEPVAAKAEPQGTWIETRTETSECFEMKTQTQLAMTQEGLNLPVSKDEPVFCVLYPRLRSEKAPVFAAVADGRGVKVTHAAGTDYAFLSSEPFDCQDGELTFHGTVGSVQLRKGKPVLFLGAPGKISYGGEQKVMELP